MSLRDDEHAERTACSAVYQPLAVDFAHHDVERADDGRHVGNQAAATEFVRHRQIAEATAASPGTQGIGEPSLTI